MLKRVLIYTCIVFSTVIFIQTNAHSEKYIVVVGGQTIAATALFECMPVFIKEGSIVPFCPEMQYTGEKPADLVTLCVYGVSALFTLDEDENNNYNYEKGVFSNIRFTYQNLIDLNH